MQDLRVFSFKRGKKEHAGLAVGDRLFDLTWILSEWPGREDLDLPDHVTVLDLLTSGCFSLAFFQEAWNYAQESELAETARLEGDVTFLPPVTRPQKIICIGRNYAAHAREGGAEVPTEPIFFAKAPSALIGHQEPVVLPPRSQRVDHEAELAVVIGRTAKCVAKEEAMEFVAGFTILNDVTARDLQKLDIQAGMPWFRSKSFDTFCPCGPWIVPRELVPEPHNLTIELRVNGETRQRANTADMVFKISDLIEYISDHLSLMPGDIIATGTPEGVSPLKPGYRMEIEITGLGLLANPVVAAE